VECRALLEKHAQNDSNLSCQNALQLTKKEKHNEPDLKRFKLAVAAAQTAATPSGVVNTSAFRLDPAIKLIPSFNENRVDEYLFNQL
jgi:hypothetical protein